MRSHFVLPRSAYLPTPARCDAPAVTTHPTGTDLEVVTWTSGGRAFLVLWRGKSDKPYLGPYSYSTVAMRDGRVDEVVKAEREAVAAKLAKRAARTAECHPYKGGEVLSCSWGYDQTNVDYYEVVRVVSPKTVVLREINARHAGGDHVTACPGDYVSEKTITCRPHADGSVSLASYKYATRWDGSPDYVTPLNAGH